MAGLAYVTSMRWRRFKILARATHETPHAAMAGRQKTRDGMAIAQMSHGHVTNPIDLLEDIASRNDWACDRTSADELTMTVAGQWTDYHVSLNWRDDLESLHIACAFDVKVPDNRLSEVYRLVAQINEQLWLGHFDVWIHEGLIMFRQGLMLNGALATPSQCEALLKAAPRSLRALLSGLPVRRLGRQGQPRGPGLDDVSRPKVRRRLLQQNPVSVPRTTAARSLYRGISLRSWNVNPVASL